MIPMSLWCSVSGRVRVILAAVLALATASVPAAAQSPLSGMRPVQEWPLGSCASDPVTRRICLNAPGIWAEFGHGAPEIEVAVVETFQTVTIGQVLSQHPWLQHLEIPLFWHTQIDSPRELLRPNLLSLPEPLRDRVPALERICDRIVAENIVAAEEIPEYCLTLDAAEASFARAYLDWRSGQQHELKMIGLIAGQSAGTLRRTGLAPLGSVSLHFIGTTPTPRGLRRLADRLDRRPQVRVVNFSNEGPPQELLDLQFARIYRSAMALNAGRRAITGDNPDDRLFVASSANTTGILRANAAYPRPNRLLPPEAIIDRPLPSEILSLHRPAIAYALPAPDVPLLVVGGIAADGRLAARTRLEPMIDLYAPSGTDPRRAERSRAQNAELQLGAVRAIQGCGEVGGPAANEAVATLDWAPTDDIRSARILEASEAEWDAAASGAIFGAVGCGAGRNVEDGIYFTRIIGNSVATALVSATAAQMFALDPQLSAADARDILVQTARDNRVSGLPVLDAHAALTEVRRRLVLRMAPSWAPGSGEPVPQSIDSRSVAPTGFGQSAWRALRDDPPLELRFTARRAVGNGLCRLTNLRVLTTVRHDGERRVRVAGPPETVARLIAPCPGRS